VEGALGTVNLQIHFAADNDHQYKISKQEKVTYNAEKFATCDPMSLHSFLQYKCTPR